MTPTPSPRFRRRLRNAAIVLVGWVVVAGAASALLPNVSVDGAASAAGAGLVGAFHMHTLRSDGGGTVDDLVDAALAHGLDFIVVTDHNTEEPTRYEYRRGVLVILAEELTTLTGHATLLDVDTVHVSEPDSVDRLHGLPFHRSIDDAGLRIAAHPNGRRFWRDRTLGTVDGLEIWNADSEWRNDGLLDWLEALTLLPFRDELAMLALVDRPARNLALLDSAYAHRRLSTLCAVDAHSKIRITDRFFLRFPSYETSVGLVRQRLTEAPELSGDADVDGPAVVGALRRGQGWCALGGVADEGGVRIRLEAGRLAVALPDGAPRSRIRVYRDGEVVDSGEGSALDVDATGPGTYRVEVDVRVRLLRPRWLPWILSAPMRVGVGPDDPPPELLGVFEDDYGSRYTISPTSWVHEPDSRYAVEEWRASEGYVIARNDRSNPADAGLWTRIDWIELEGMEPWSWAFCIAAWDARGFAEARGADTVDRSEPLDGCGGFPFSRMRRIQ